MYKKIILKRIFVILAVSWITFISVFNAYQTTVDAAEYVAGAVAAVGGGPILTALLVGGVVVAGGIALYELSQTDGQDHRDFVTGIKSGFQEFVQEQEKQIALEQDSSLTDQEASDIGVANARNTVNNFFDNAVETTKNTVSNIKKSTVDYWNEYNKQISDVADNGISDGNIDIGDLLPNRTIANANLENYDYNTTIALCMPKYNDNNLMATINGKNYICQGQYSYCTNNGEDYVTYDANNYDFNRLYYIHIQPSTNQIYTSLKYLDITHINSPSIKTVGSGTNLNTYYKDTWFPNNAYNRFDNLIVAMGMSSLPIIYSYGDTNDDSYLKTNWRDLLACSADVNSTPVWKRTINNTLNNTHIGKAIKTGRREVVNTGDYITGIFKEDSVPVKKSSLAVNEGVVSGSIGWDIPAGNVWDDVFSGGRPYSDVVGQTGAIGVPDDVITGTRQGDTVVDYPDTASVQDSSDYPKTDTDTPVELPDKPQTDIFENQGGDYYPTSMDLTTIFPFCIPFDIVYLVQKFKVDNANAPVINLKIPYPAIMQSALGGTGYDVVIDFSDFIVLRNIIRVFILLLFISGLMKITRDLIRG